MPLTGKGEEIKSAMEKEYGPKKGEEVFYASKNAGTISGVDEAGTFRQAAPEVVTLAEINERNRRLWQGNQGSETTINEDSFMGTVNGLLYPKR